MIETMDPVTLDQNHPPIDEVTMRVAAAVQLDRVFQAERIRREIARVEKQIKDSDYNMFDRAKYDGKIEGLRFVLQQLEQLRARLSPAPSVAEPAKCKECGFGGLGIPCDRAWREVKQTSDGACASCLHGRMCHYGASAHPRGKTDCTPASAEQAKWKCVCGSKWAHCKREFGPPSDPSKDYCLNRAHSGLNCGHPRACHKEDGKP